MIVNVQPKAWFHGQRGVRQEDPLSPFLFTLVMVVLSHLVSRPMARGLIRGVKVGSKGVEVSHLQFAIDTILFLDNDKDGFSNVLSLLQIFELSSGLKINWSKKQLSCR